MIALVNLGNSNIQSVVNALDYLDIKHIVTNKSEEIKKCSKIILPGVGSFGDGMARIRALNLFELIKNEVIKNGKPILGICLGMQLLFDSSEESKEIIGLGILQGKICALPNSENYKIPRIGWADSNVCLDFLGLEQGEDTDFYYIHSYYVKPDDDSIVSIKTDNNITASVKKNQIYGCQFHPEKSHKNGLTILKSFSEIV